MIISDFNKQITSEILNDDSFKLFGEKLDISSFDTIKLYDARNILRTKLAELTNDNQNIFEDNEYQKTKLFLDILNQEIIERENNKNLKESFTKLEISILENYTNNKVSYENLPPYLKQKIKQYYYYDLNENYIKNPNQWTKNKLTEDLDEVLDTSKSKNYFLNKAKKRVKDSENIYSFVQNNPSNDSYNDKKELDKFGNRIKKDKKFLNKQDSIEERKMTSNEKSKEKRLKKKYDNSGMKDSMKKQYGNKKGKDVYFATLRKRAMSESILREGEEDKAALIMASKDMVDKITSWMEDIARMQTEAMFDLIDSIRDELGTETAVNYENILKPALSDVYQSLDGTRHEMTRALQLITGEEEDIMGKDSDIMNLPGSDNDSPDLDLDNPEGPPPEDDFGAAPPSAGGEEPSGRLRRESLRRLGLLLSESPSFKKKV